MWQPFLHFFSEKDAHNRKRNDERPSAALPNANAAKTARGLSESQRDRFEDMLRTLLPDRNPVAETMVRDSPRKIY